MSFRSFKRFLIYFFLAFIVSSPVAGFCASLLLTISLFIPLNYSWVMPKEQLQELFHYGLLKNAFWSGLGLSAYLIPFGIIFSSIYGIVMTKRGAKLFKIRLRKFLYVLAGGVFGTFVVPPPFPFINLFLAPPIYLYTAFFTGCICAIFLIQIAVKIDRKYQIRGEAK